MELIIQLRISSRHNRKICKKFVLYIRKQKNIEHILDAVPGVLHLHWKNFKTYLHILVRIEQQMSEKDSILDEAKEEINNLPNSDIQFDYELLKTGKSFTHVRFHVYDIYDTAKIEQNGFEVIKKEIIDVKDNTSCWSIKGFGFSDKDIEKKYMLYMMKQIVI